MPLVRYKQPQIIVEIDDAVIAGTIIKRKARFENLVYSQEVPQWNSMGPVPEDAPAADNLRIQLTILLYARNEDGTYGQRLTGLPLFSDYPFGMTADATTLVAAADVPEKSIVAGQYVGTSAVYEKAKQLSVDSGLPLEQFLPEELQGVPFMYENEFFRNIAENVPALIVPMITDKIELANALGRFAVV